MASVVWVLGAGFSKSLGGPLLPTLLSRRSIERIRMAYPDLPGVGWAVQRIQDLLRDHGWEHVGSRALPPAWSDAEAFLEHLDTAAFGSPVDQARQVLRAYTPAEIRDDQFEQLAATAKRLIAAECCLFLRDANTASEKWRPYVEWARALEPTDTVITFNYDRVVELAAKAAGTELDLVAGGQPVKTGCPRLLKMHGSVDWRRRADGQDLLIDNPEFAVKCDSREICLASPGPSKQSMAEKWKGLWQGAESALREADAIAFIGYRFPQSDAVARERLLRAIMQNGAPHHVAVHSVLGADTQSADARRLHGLLSYALGRARRLPVPGGPLPFASPPKFFTLIPQPLFAEDFLGIVMRATVVDPHQDKR